jgi:L-asparaginase II
MCVKDNNDPAVLVESWRGSILESKHRGHIAVVTPKGDVVAYAGDLSAVTSLRSVAKPFQALTVITEGVDRLFGFTTEELAIIASSHSGEDVHARHVKSILTKIGIDETYLHCGQHAPMDWSAEIQGPESRADVLRNCCSGKHAGMLARCVAMKANLSNYEMSQHPIQQKIKSLIGEIVDIEPASMGDGVESCGAPIVALPMRSIALAYAKLVSPGLLTRSLRVACETIRTSILKHPELVGGSHGRLCTDIMRTCRGNMIAKSGAEGVFGMGLLPNSKYADGIGMAIKIEDGAERAIGPVATEVLLQLGLLDESQGCELGSWHRKPINNFRGHIVGEFVPAYRLTTC